MKKKLLKKDYIKIYTYMLRSEEHTSELQSRRNLVCRLLLEKKKWRCVQGAVSNADTVAT